MNLSHLTTRPTLTCIRAGFEGIPVETSLPLRVFKRVTTEKIAAPVAGESATFEHHQAEMIVELTTPDGTRHRFHPRTEDARLAAATSLDPDTASWLRSLGHAATPVRHHSLGPLLRHFHTAAPTTPSTAGEQTHPIFDLIQALFAAQEQIDSSPNKS